ncbi:WD40 repeat domain-containing protein [Streptosporangium sp. NPDC006013]|uniref:NACHT and WD repeat domain-containing protein n=1 Tax=Streptosporangium sp. NPDC006013 TaxID=3155596 RepID=UPI0033AED216
MPSEQNTDQNTEENAGPDDVARSAEEQGRLVREHARRGARAWVAGFARRSGRAAARAAPRVALVGLCASTLAPVAVAGLELPLLVAGAGAAGSVGANLLSEVISKALAVARGRGGEGPTSSSAVSRELASLLEEALQAGDQRARDLATTMSSVLHEVGVVQMVVAEAVERGDELLLQELVAGFSQLGEQFDSFTPLLEQLGAAAERIEQRLYQQDAEKHHDRNRDERLMAMVMSLRESVTVALRHVAPLEWDPDGVGREPWTGECPYQGLVPYGAEQASVFYGRGRATGRLAAMVAAQVRHPGPIVVTGASGAGKSSLLRAGLLPGLGAGLIASMQSVRQWPSLVLTPSQQPMRELAVALAVPCRADPDVVLARLWDDPEHAVRRLHEVLLADEALRREAGEARRAGPRRAIVVVDQLEELFLPGSGAGVREEEERLRFLAALDAMATVPQTMDGEPGAVVITAVRGDFVDRCAAYPVLAEALEQRAFVLGPMSADELSRAITGPAAVAGLEVEEGLAEQVVRELVGHHRSGPEIGDLPLLSLAMARTWENRGNARLTRDGYDRAGGVAHAVQDTAEAVYAGLKDDRHRDVARDALLLLTSSRADGPAVRRRMAREDLLQACEPARPEEVEHVLNAFTRQRLLVLSRPTETSSSSADPAPETVMVELAHDVLLTGWQKLAAWLTEEQQDRVAYDELVRDAREWDTADRDSSFLYTGTRLQQARLAQEHWQSRAHVLSLPDHAADFLREGVRASKRVRRGRQGAFAALAVMMVVALMAAAFAVASSRAEERQRAEALSRRLVALIATTDELRLARHLATTAWRISPTIEAARAMTSLLATQRAVLVGHTDDVKTVAYSSAGGMLASGGDDGTIRLWDPSTGRALGAPLKSHTGVVTKVAFTPDGRVLASEGSDGAVRLWDPPTGRRIGAVMTGHRLVPGSDGRLLTAAYTREAVTYEVSVRLSDVRTGRTVGRELKGVVDPAAPMAYNAKDDVLAVARRDNGVVYLWDVRAGRPLGSIRTGHTNGATALAFSPGGDRLASAGGTGAPRLWDWRKRRPIHTLATEPAVSAYGVAFSPDGRTLATTYADGTARLWNAVTGKQIGSPLTGHTGMRDYAPSFSRPVVYVAAFSHDGQQVATGGLDQTVRLWDTTTGGAAGAGPGQVGRSFTLAFSSDGGLLAATSDSEGVRLIDARTGWILDRRPAVNPDKMIRAAALSPDGRLLAAGEYNGNVRLWNPRTGAVVGSPGGYLLLGEKVLAFSPDSSLLATASYYGDEVILVDTRTLRTVRRIPILLVAQAIGFSPDGRTLATAGKEDKIRLWDPATGRQVAELPLDDDEDDGARSLAFSRDGRLLAAVSDGTHVWDVSSRAQVSRLDGMDDDEGRPGTSGTAFSPDGRLLATGHRDGAVRLWDPRTGTQVGAPIIGHDNQVLAVAFSPDGRLATSSDDGTIRFWDPGAHSDPVRALCAQAGPVWQKQWSRIAPGAPSSACS